MQEDEDAEDEMDQSLDKQEE